MTFRSARGDTMVHFFVVAMRSRVRDKEQIFVRSMDIGKGILGVVFLHI